MSDRRSRLLDLAIPSVQQRYGSRDAILYALGVGVGCDPTAASHLAFTYEEGLQALPSFAVVLGHPGFWPRDLDTGLDWRRIVHGEQTLRLHRPLPTAATVQSVSRVIGVEDKGSAKGAIVVYERELSVDGQPLATVGQTLFCRGDGGMGSFGHAATPLGPTPDRPADLAESLTIPPQAALIYRLSGDLNPLHALPSAAAAAGFDRPILHGLATYGAATFCLLQATGEPARSLRRLDCRFRAPVFPGETLKTEIWREAGAARFRVTSVGRNTVVISHGYAEFTNDEQDPA